MEQTRNVDLFMLTFKCDLDHGRSDLDAALCTLSHYGDHLCQVMFKTFQFKTYETDTRMLRTDEQTGGQTKVIPIIPSPLRGRGLKLWKVVCLVHVTVHRTIIEYENLQ